MTHMHRKLFWGARFLEAPLQNGVGRYVQQLQRITFKFCKTSGASLGVREYIEKDLIQFARNNEGVVVYVKPRRKRTPCLKVEYLNGEEDYISLHKESRADVAKWVDFLRSKSAGPVKLLLNTIHTDHPSVQGPWTPFTHKDPSINLESFPCERLSAMPTLEKTATEELVEIFERQKRLQNEHQMEKE